MEYIHSFVDYLAMKYILQNHIYMDMVENLQDYICTDAAPEQKAIWDSSYIIYGSGHTGMGRLNRASEKKSHVSTFGVA